MTGPTRSVASLDKFDVLSGLFGSWDGIARLVDGLPDTRWQTLTPLPGWTVYDVVAHIIGTESMLGGAPTPGTDLDVATLGHVRNGVGEMNECWIRHLRGGSGAGRNPGTARGPTACRAPRHRCRRWRRSPGRHARQN